MTVTLGRRNDWRKAGHWQIPRELLYLIHRVHTWFNKEKIYLLFTVSYNCFCVTVSFMSCVCCFQFFFDKLVLLKMTSNRYCKKNNDVSLYSMRTRFPIIVNRRMVSWHPRVSNETNLQRTGSWYLSEDGSQVATADLNLLHLTVISFNSSKSSWEEWSSSISEVMPVMKSRNLK